MNLLTTRICCDCCDCRQRRGWTYLLAWQGLLRTCDCFACAQSRISSQLASQGADQIYLASKLPSQVASMSLRALLLHNDFLTPLAHYPWYLKRKHKTWVIVQGITKMTNQPLKTSQLIQHIVISWAMPLGALLCCIPPNSTLKNRRPKCMVSWRQGPTLVPGWPTPVWGPREE